jgi:hypothetical protein
MTSPSNPRQGGPAAQKAADKVRALLGEERGNAAITDAMRTAGLSSLEAADERYRFGAELSKKGGLLEAVGRAIMVQAILQGAQAA